MILDICLSQTSPSEAYDHGASITGLPAVECCQLFVKPTFSSPDPERIFPTQPNTSFDT
ncbi:MAG TPA: hypothetical protein VMN36_02375 [Verrucomicrobiales bacterium]|nr:hypothetical protein [Verrucomicrobiales bacterium]